jgi:predicted house-cleaning noncanonical NTP pyrophosphatase (MazG superfamily)
LNKLTEEVGEFAQVVNKTLGIKKKAISDTDESIKDDMCEEASDAIQIIVGICALNGITYEQLMNKLHEKNVEYRKFIYEKNSLE